MLRYNEILNGFEGSDDDDMDGIDYDSIDSIDSIDDLVDADESDEDLKWDWRRYMENKEALAQAKDIEMVKRYWDERP